MSTAPAVFRAPLRSRDDEVDSAAAVERALRHAVCGVGGRLHPVPRSLEAATAAAAAQHGERLARRVERFAAAPDGSFVWTRDVDGFFWLGRLDGPWRYDAHPDAVAVDLVHVRPCRWRSRPAPDAAVPDGVRATSARGGRNWQQIHHGAVAGTTESVWEALADAAPFDRRSRSSPDPGGSRP